MDEPLDVLFVMCWGSLYGTSLRVLLSLRITLVPHMRFFNDIALLSNKNTENGHLFVL